MSTTEETKAMAGHCAESVQAKSTTEESELSEGLSSLSLSGASSTPSVHNEIHAELTNPRWGSIFIDRAHLNIDESAKPVGESTFSVFSGKMGNTDIIAKVIPIDSLDRLHYAKDEVEHTFRTRGYANWKCVRLGAYSTDAENCKVYIIAELNVGFVPTSTDLENATQVKQDQWILDLSEALACCHINNVFHQDVRNGPSTYSPNVMIDTHEPNTLRLIDMGDSVIPDCDQKSAAALLVDLQGMLAFVDMFGAGHFSDSVRGFIHTVRGDCNNIENRTVLPTSNQCQLYLWNRTNHLRSFPFNVMPVIIVNGLVPAEADL